MASRFLVAEFDRLCIRAVGADVGTYLHSQLSNDITSMVDGESRQSFILEPTGKIVALVRVTRSSSDSFLLDTDPLPGLDEIVLTRLNKFKIRVEVDFSVEIQRCVAIRSLDDEPIGPSVRESIAGTMPVVVVDAWWGNGTAVDVLPMSKGDHVDARHVAELVPGSIDVANPLDELEAERLRVGWPGMGSEIDPGETLVAAIGITTRAVSFTKGCYPGQELVERMDSRGSTAPRTLRRFRRGDLGGSDASPPRVGDPVIVDGTDVGVVTSVAGAWALAYVARGVDAGEIINRQD